jgi:hypothetical protein
MIIKNISKLVDKKNKSLICPVGLKIGNKNYLFFSSIDKSKKAKLGYCNLLIEDKKKILKVNNFTELKKINKLGIFKDGCIITSILKDKNTLIFFCASFKKKNKLDYKLKPYFFKTNLNFELKNKPKLLFNNEFKNFRFAGSVSCLKEKNTYTIYYSIGNNWYIHNKNKKYPIYKVYHTKTKNFKKYSFNKKPLIDFVDKNDEYGIGRPSRLDLKNNLMLFSVRNKKNYYSQKICRVNNNKITRINLRLSNNNKFKLNIDNICYGCFFKYKNKKIILFNNNNLKKASIYCGYLS